MPPKTPPPSHLSLPAPKLPRPPLCFPPTATLALHFNRICISTLHYSLECKNTTTIRKKVALKKLQLQMHLLGKAICSHYASKQNTRTDRSFCTDWILLQPTHIKASHYTFLQSCFPTLLAYHKASKHYYLMAK